MITEFLGMSRSISIGDKHICTSKIEFDADAKISYYQNENLTAEYFLKRDDGHPPLNGILASIFNLVFYQNLAIYGDIESYHLFNIVASTLMVVVVVVFAYQTYGVFVA